MKCKKIERWQTLGQMLIFYLAMIAIMVMLHMLLGMIVGRTQIAYSYISKTMLEMGVFIGLFLIFLTDFIFENIKYRMRLLACLISGFILIEGYTILVGLLKVQKPFAYLCNNQMIFLKFFFLLVGWFFYAKISSYRYAKLLKAYQK